MDNMTLKLGQVQLMVGRDKAENLRRACVLIRRAAEQGVRLALLSDYYSARSSAPKHIVLVNYSGIALKRLPEGLRRLAQAWEE